MASRSVPAGTLLLCLLGVFMLLRGLNAFSSFGPRSWQRQPTLSKRQAEQATVNGVRLESAEDAKSAQESKPMGTSKEGKAQATVTATAEEVGPIDWADLAARAREISAEGAAAEDDKDMNTRYIARAKKSIGGAAAKVFEEAAAAPSWVPFAALGGAVVAVIVLIGATSSLRTQSAKAPVAPAPPPKVVSVSPPAPPPAIVAQVAPAPVTQKSPTPEPQVVAPSSVAQPSAVAPPVAAPAAPPAPKPVPVQQAAPEGRDYGWARKLTGAVAGGLRGLADALPSAEQTLEETTPTVVGGLRWTSEIRPENLETKAKEALPVVGRAVTQGVDFAARAGLQGGSLGLKLAADELPEAGQVLQKAADSAVPGIQAGARATANFTRTLADKALELSSPESTAPENIKPLAKAVPTVLGGVATGLDVIADIAPGAEAAVSYGASKALPVVKAALEAISDVTADVSKADTSKLPVPEPSQVASALKAVGVDPDRVLAGAQGLAQGAASKVSTSLPNTVQGVPNP